MSCLSAVFNEIYFENYNQDLSIDDMYNCFIDLQLLEIRQRNYFILSVFYNVLEYKQYIIHIFKDNKSTCFDITNDLLNSSKDQWVDILNVKSTSSGMSNASKYFEKTKLGILGEIFFEYKLNLIKLISPIIRCKDLSKVERQKLKQHISTLKPFDLKLK